jgi:sterol desaturase/sphingolipid hydroxylase (fatty acid hydroxylase superfamily)
MTAPRGVLAQIGFALAFAFIWDLWQYWVHRLQHAWPVFWETHKFHHSETGPNATAQARHHMLHYVLNTVLYLPLVLFWGGLTPHFLATFMMFSLWGFVNTCQRAAKSRISYSGRCRPAMASYPSFDYS